MKSNGSERNLLACILALLAAVTPLFFAACGSDVIAPLSSGNPQQDTAPTIKSIVPNSAPPAGGTSVTINGSNFSSSDQTTPPSVSFGGVPAKKVTMVSASQLVATVPPHALGKVSVQLTAADGMSSSFPGGFIYAASSPTLSSVSPKSGGSRGGTAVTITGSNFASGAKVSFGGTPASVSFVSSSQLKAVTPAHAAGSVSVAVTNPDSTSAVLPGGFTFGSPSSLGISSVTPNSGGTGGGTAVTITGTNFASGAKVSFGGSPASGVSFVSANQLTATTPAHAAGSVNVAVTNPDNTTAALPAGFTFGSTSSSLSVSSVSPVSGPAAGGTKVTISGANFQAGVSVTFGGLPAGSVTLSNSSTIVAVAPQHSSGLATVTITNTNGQSASWAKNFAFHSIDLVWNAPSTSPVTIAGYNIYRGGSSAGPFGKLNGSTPLTDTSFIDETVQGSTTYYYEVKSVDSDGTESPPAGPVPATTASP